MILSSLISASLVLGAHSFLVPGELDVSQADNAPALFNNEEAITLDCSSCPYALDSERHEGHEWTNDVRSDLHMKFDTEGGVLRMNGVQFYPIPMAAPPALHVTQTKKEDEDTTFQGYSGDLRLSYSLELDEKKAQDGSSLVSVVMTVLALDGQMIKIDNVEVKTIKTADGKVSTSAILSNGPELIIYSLSSTPSHPSQSIQTRSTPNVATSCAACWPRSSQQSQRQRHRSRLPQRK